MKIEYFRGTALRACSARPVRETREIGENLYVDLDEAGVVVSITVEHAGRDAAFPDVLVEEFASSG
ncbi:MAG: DUF2283 domain-containing protein [Pseudomonadales bacterium]|jgi:uncharacterized protein YuzE|nr:DUF2283 domain-containing protein [Pseudomonadales bacterium]